MTSATPRPDRIETAPADGRAASSGDMTYARTPVGAEAVRNVLAGASVSEAYQQAGITLPPAGTPVAEPIPPTQLQAGYVGVWNDHMVMALGNGKALVAGRVAPLESVGSGPDFLGWFDPTSTSPAQRGL